MKLQLAQGIRQQLRLTPQLQQALKLMGLSALELEAEVEQMLEDNPLLERVEYPRHKIDYSIDTMPENPASLREYLYWQLNLTNLTTADKLIACNIIDAINEDGYLSISLQELCNAATDTSLEKLDKLLKQVQQLDPPGVGARNLQECLALQNTDPTCAQIIAQCMELLAKHDYQQICKKLNITKEQTETAIANILKLNPKPGNILAYPSKHEYLIPDIIVTTQQQHLHVHLNPELDINLKINYSYASHMQQQLREAQWLLHSLKTRNQTMLTVASWIVKYQHEFFSGGETQMRPLKMLDLANALAISESTVSRICSNKFMDTPRGTFKFKYFFSTELSNGCSSTAIKAIICELIKNESPIKPLSDSSICAELAKHKIYLARRTVAKYRETMSILPAHRRKSGITK